MADFQSNRAVNPLSVMAQERRYEDYRQQVREQRHETGVMVSQSTSTRVVQESLDAVLRNIGTLLAD